MGKRYKNIHFLGIGCACNEPLFFSFFQKNPHVTNRKVRDTIMEMKRIVSRHIKKENTTDENPYKNHITLGFHVRFREKELASN